MFCVASYAAYTGGGATAIHAVLLLPQDEHLVSWWLQSVKQNQGNECVCVCINMQTPDAESVTVSQEDFWEALSQLQPSLSQAELQRYDRLREHYESRTR